MGNFISDAWDDLTGVTAAGEASDVMLEALEQSTALGYESLDFQKEQAAWQQAQIAAQQEQVAPYQEAGLAALGRYQDILADPSALADDPALQYLQQQGSERVESSGAARGTQLSGRTLEELSRTGTSIASQYRGQILGELGNLMGMGTGLGMQQTGMAVGASQGSTAGIAGGYGNLADLYMQGGQVQAANIMGAYQGQSSLLGAGLMAYGMS